MNQTTIKVGVGVAMQPAFRADGVGGMVDELAVSYYVDQWGVLIYKSVSDLNVTIVQPRDLNFRGRITFIL